MTQPTPEATISADRSSISSLALAGSSTDILPFDDLDGREISPVEPPIRIMALHAMLYCERLFYLEEV